MKILRSFYFIRHGETDWNKEQRLQGSMDIPLNDRGREQAREASFKTATLPVDLIISSTLSRAIETAKIINEKLNKPLETDQNLIEKNYGIFEGMEKTDREKWAEEKIKSDPNVFVEPNGFPLPDGAEAYDAFKERVFKSINHHLEKNTGKEILFVAHAGIYRALHRTLMGFNNQPENAAPFLFKKTGDKWEIKQL